MPKSQNQEYNKLIDSPFLEDKLCHNLYVVSNAITRMYRTSLEKIDLTYPQYVVMMALWEKDDVSVSELHQKTHIDIGSLSLILKKMCNKEVISMVTNQSDKRIKQVQLTARGSIMKQVMEQEKAKFKESYKQVLTEKEFSDLLVLLKKLKSGLLEY